MFLPGKASWAGCGQHLDSVFRNITVDNRCKCGYKEADWSALIQRKKTESTFNGPFPKGGA